VKVVFDVNVFIAAALSRNGVPAMLVRAGLMESRDTGTSGES